jgi:aspartyl-tRNA(Asn)/glutamyl-tRNA(Gln) amidotransferase subunit B
MRTRLQLDCGISSYDAATLTADREIAEYFEAVARN